MNKEKALKNQGLEFREDMTVVGGAAAICIVSLLVSIVCKAWWGKVPLAGRGGYGLDE